ncbi:Hypothetical predicted protein, partial [Marmota monax]
VARDLEMAADRTQPPSAALLLTGLWAKPEWDTCQADEDFSGSSEFKANPRWN